MPIPVNKGLIRFVRPAPCRRLPLLMLTVLTLSACGPKSVTTGPATEDDARPPVVEAESEQRGSEQQEKFEQGIKALAAGDLEQARRLFSDITRQNPTLSGPHANLALIDFRQKDLQQALVRINRAIELNPSSHQAFHLRAQILLQQGEIKKARDDYQQAIDLNPEYLNAHYNLALLYDIYLQEIALAIDHYTIYLSLLGEKDETIEEWLNHLKGTLENG